MTIPIWLFVLIVLGSMVAGSVLAAWVAIWLIDSAGSGTTLPTKL